MTPAATTAHTLLVRKGAAAPSAAVAPDQASGPDVEPARPPADVPADLPAGKARILALTSDDLNARLYVELLEARGYEAAAARSVAGWGDAIAIFKPDLVLLDIGFPRHASLAAAEILRAAPNFRALPMIALTDASDRGAETRRIASACAGRISKPVSVAAFYEPIERCVAERAAS